MSIGETCDSSVRDPAFTEIRMIWQNYVSSYCMIWYNLDNVDTVLTAVQAE